MMVPKEWTRLIANLHDAKIERAVLEKAEGPAHDEAMGRYVSFVDAIMDDLAELSRSQTLGRITALLCKKERG